ncbi:sugar kinase [Sulfitobacter sp. D35]|uniref:tagatose kinase n=1 Tax=Sulfitobacter sp. D35 TaxID=3083252 RepID=UPI00296FCBAE|nr:sugar kinase [Sulfitobacter sp. D35]MDW4498877.1 sugar kinase [Sulfitobacter sp. D35]
MKKIVVIGEILVEIMADTPGHGFREAQALTGPFPSGAPAIFAAQAARIGQPVAIVSAVGDDDFGRLNLDRLARDGVDVSGVHVDPHRPTGSAFVRYRGDGGRDFVFNIRHSACGHLHDTPAVRSVLASADHLHVMGSSLASPEFVARNMAAAEAVRDHGGTISFDPNLRKEILAAPGMAEAMSRIVSMTDLYLPSGDELTLLTEAQTDVTAIGELLDRGVRAIVHKRGADGAGYHDAHHDLSIPAFEVTEVDPTGAGDCFGATFTALWLRGVPPKSALQTAAASGAHAVTRRGPMEGTADLATLEDFIRAQEADR